MHVKLCTKLMGLSYLSILSDTVPLKGADVLFKKELVAQGWNGSLAQEVNCQAKKNAEEIIFREPPLHIVSEQSGHPATFARPELSNILKI